MGNVFVDVSIVVFRDGVGAVLFNLLCCNGFRGVEYIEVFLDYGYYGGGV